MFRNEIYLKKTKTKCLVAALQRREAVLSFYFLFFYEVKNGSAEYLRTK